MLRNDRQHPASLFPAVTIKRELVSVFATDRVIGCSDLSGKMEGYADNCACDISGFRPVSQIQWKKNTRGDGRS